MPEGKYRKKARHDARVIARVDLFKEIVDEVLKQKGLTDKVHITDYPSGQRHTPEAPNVSIWEACDLLEELSDYEETDSAYWQEKEVREALKICAGLTYRNAVNAYFTKFIDQINELLGNMDIPWILQERYILEYRKDNPGQGVLDWDPDFKAIEKLPARERAFLEDRHQKLLAREMAALLSLSIQNS